MHRKQDEKRQTAGFVFLHREFLPPADADTVAFSGSASDTQLRRRFGCPPLAYHILDLAFDCGASHYIIAPFTQLIQFRLVAPYCLYKHYINVNVGGSMLF